MLLKCLQSIKKELQDTKNYCYIIFLSYSVVILNKVTEYRCYTVTIKFYFIENNNTWDKPDIRCNLTIKFHFIENRNETSDPGNTNIT